jgi:uncharacterized protein (DUF486 family)
MKQILVPMMVVASGGFMALAWLGHLRFRERGFWLALAMSWLIVLPEYLLNVAATRYGYGTFTGGQMAAMHLASGVLFVTLVSKYVLGEETGGQQYMGMAFLAIGMVLLMYKP